MALFLVYVFNQNVDFTKNRVNSYKYNTIKHTRYFLD